MTAVDTVATRSRPTGVQTARDLTLLLGRVGLAVLMIAHAKLEYDYGGGSIGGVGRLFEQAGSRWPRSPGQPTCCSRRSVASH
jgi:putative oxidoreductase